MKNNQIGFNNEIIQKQRVKINEIHSLSLLMYDNDVVEIAHMKNNKICYDILNDVIRVHVDDLIEQMNDIGLQILYTILNDEYDDVEIVETFILIETFSYKIYIDMTLNERTYKFEYDTSTTNMLTFDNTIDFDENVKNRDIRKTIRGLKNYINKFDK